MKSEHKPVGSRRAAREAAFKAIYAMTVGGLELEPAMDPEVLGMEFVPESLSYIQKVAGGVMANPTMWDERFSPSLTANWRLERLALTDKILLRMATYELWHFPELPPKVVLSSYVALAERYGTKESGKFVNGVLSQVWKTSPKAQWTPPSPSAEPAVEAASEPSPKPKRTKKSWTIKAED